MTAGALLTALGSGLAVSVELLEALAIVLAVGVTRRWGDAVLGALAGVLVCALTAALLGPVLLHGIPIDSLRLTIGALLLLFGLEWLRKAVLRLAGAKARSSVLREFAETEEELADDPLPPEGEPDWAGRIVAFKGVVLEGVEIVLIVSTLAERPSGPAPALVGAAAALALVAALGVWLRGPLTRLPETEMKWGVGVLLTTFGIFFCGEGLHLHWPGGEMAVLWLGALMAAASFTLSRAVARPR
ncbi:TMEM165/GDT1 family protein [Paraconexibacter antarcticus]|uniref:TMEM165/GDT1 family protein n=1 Tax=Paraconexibacter antarcticus TaxID=2949664 RepID=A0ABY5DUT3_9ACTN|nr:TMEM165/GDT1 family protein [Paraconexibacter antarcticus]UTI65441.1 TMEM165/GDT1 family protein [Paraconexibacter antarcticus]